MISVGDTHLFVMCVRRYSELEEEDKGGYNGKNENTVLLELLFSTSHNSLLPIYVVTLSLSSNKS